MNEKPPVQPMMQLDLQVEHSPFVTPGLDLFDAGAISLRHAQLNKSKHIIGKTLIAEPESVAPLRG